MSLNPKDRVALERSRKLQAPEDFPRLATSVNIHDCIAAIRHQDCKFDFFPFPAEQDSPRNSSNSRDYQSWYNSRVIFAMHDESISEVTRAIQEEEILQTKLKLRVNDRVVDLSSFWEVWHTNPSFRKEIQESSDPHEMKWQLQMKYNYKIATTFMPSYAKSIFSYFDSCRVLDPCAGWGDRLLGALCCKSVKQYVGFDPNLSLRVGYIDIVQNSFHPKCREESNLERLGEVTEICDDYIKFDNGFTIYSLPFEVGAVKYLQDESFDFAFTSPPFFDYEMYNPDNPQYTNWITQFYIPLFQQVCRCLPVHAFFGIHIGDTSAGAIMPFLVNQVHVCSTFEYKFSVGLMGMKSNKIRSVFMFQKMGPYPKVSLKKRNLLRNPWQKCVSKRHGCPYWFNIETKETVWKNPAFIRIRELTNRPITVLKVFSPDKLRQFNVFDDSVSVGGTKQRLLGRFVETIDSKVQEVIYAGPDTGLAQVALAYCCLLYKKKSVVFLNTWEHQSPKPILTQIALAFHCDVRYSCNPKGRSLKETESDALEYQKADPSSRLLLPFGLKSEKGSILYECFKSVLLEIIEKLDLPAPPKRLWVVAGSGFILNILHSIWPLTEFLIVQVGKKIWDDMIEHIPHHRLFVAPEQFHVDAKLQPPYSTVPWYDAKSWQFVLDHGMSGDYIWNVGSIPSDIENIVSRHLVEAADLVH